MPEPTDAPIVPATDTSVITGQENVNDDLFEMEEDNLTPELDQETSTEEPNAQKENQDRDNVEDGDPTPESEDTPPEDKEGKENKEEKPAEQTPEDKGEPRKFAGKYDSLEQLKAAYVRLAGDPARFGDNVEALEEAYSIRQSEFTRARQEEAEKMRIREENERREAEEKKPVFTEDEVNGILDHVDWSKVNDARDLGKALLTMISENLPRGGQPLNDEQVAQIVAKQQAQASEREAKLTELHALETKVPRLKTDIVFRNSFANYLEGLKINGGFTTLESAMKDFVGVNQTIVDEIGKVYSENQDNKATAQVSTPPDNGGSSSAARKSTPEDDILDGIVSEYKKEVDKFSV